ncbi:MAG: Glyoxalase/bleomycin resistance protein/dioxygenase [Microbacteriaceae bacterium]|jgi:catechol 2,3-dioxygenase-like lactoylglutathione lyase family enzyme|nr:Glyoxalase/bleomycin resistance protein/dioxygenase [Microbacteriaceae bacterium]
MLKELHTVLPAADLQRARTYYHDKLSLDPDQEEDGSLMYHLTSESAFEIYETSNAGTAQNTQMGWMTDDLENEMNTLRERGVVFEDYDVPGMKTVNGVATMEGMKSAWFRDSEGNFICVSQRI